MADGSGLSRRGARQSRIGHRDLCRRALQIDNWRWAGVPFYLRAGKRLAKRATEITIQFKQPPLLIFDRHATSTALPEIQPNLLTIRIQPDEGIALRFGAKVPPRRRWPSAR
jgi:glucose-6-phosphate 1-dehydrogenase